MSSATGSPSGATSCGAPRVARFTAARCACHATNTLMVRSERVCCSARCAAILVSIALIILRAGAAGATGSVVRTRTPGAPASALASASPAAIRTSTAGCSAPPPELRESAPEEAVAPRGSGRGGGATRRAAPRSSPKHAVHMSKSHPKPQRIRISDGGSSRPQPPSQSKHSSAVSSIETSSCVPHRVQSFPMLSSSSPKSRSRSSPLPSEASLVASDTALSLPPCSDADSQPATCWSSASDSPLLEPSNKSEPSMTEASEPLSDMRSAGRFRPTRA
eukprot:4304341-Prymnesium_polylepis.2